MKIVTGSFELINSLLDYIAGYSVSRRSDERDDWEFTVEMDERMTCSISKNKETLTVKTSETGYKVINLGLYHDWHIEP